MNSFIGRDQGDDLYRGLDVCDLKSNYSTLIRPIDLTDHESNESKM